MKTAAEFDLNGPQKEAGETLRIEAPKTSVDLAAAHCAVRDLLVALGCDLADEGLVETPQRVAAALAELVTPPPFKMTTFANTGRYDELVLVRAIPFHSLCQHHLLPFVGVAHVGYVPADSIVGLSKLARVAQALQHRRAPRPCRRGDLVAAAVCLSSASPPSRSR
jgi:GTP cyclohydrolase I